MPTSLYAEFSTEFGIGQNSGGKSATGTPTSEMLLSYRKQREVGEPNADFRTVQALFIVGIWFVNFNTWFGCTRSLEVDEPVANFGFFLGTVQSWKIDCRLQFKIFLVESGNGIADFEVFF